MSVPERAGTNLRAPEFSASQRMPRGDYLNEDFFASKHSSSVATAMMPNAILFDLDDTLFDHKRASALAVQVIHSQYASAIEFEAFLVKHHEVLEEFHQHFLSGRCTLDEARVARMRALFAAFDRQIDDFTAQRIAGQYRAQHQASRALVPGARELLDALHGQAPLGIITNNSTAEQHEKLRALDIAHYFDTIVISEEVGLTKPDTRIFDMALERIGARAEESVFVGDSWQNDIQGAIRSGMAAVWLNREKRVETQGLAHLFGPFVSESRSSAGVSLSTPVEIHSLAPLSATLAAIKKAFANRTPGVNENEQLDTLAT